MTVHPLVKHMSTKPDFLDDETYEKYLKVVSNHFALPENKSILDEIKVKSMER